jgi:hypothetical protein
VRLLARGFLVATIALAAAPVRAQVSPGPLAAAHAALDGATDCFRCHARGTGKSGMDQRCLACHTEVGWMRARQRGFHARVANQACASCHPDHGGRGFALVAWDGGRPEGFAHARAGWTLAGRHAEIACRDCHKPAFQRSGAVPLLRVKDRARSWLGLEPACGSCHADPHRGRLGSDCLACHDQAKWSPAPRFDHARTRYALTGAHARLACADCHTTAQVNGGTDARGALRPRWSPVPHADCVSCHRDPHAGRFRGACAACHTTAGWRAVNAKGFDHDQTRYPLRGAHAAVRCDDCHAAARGGKRPRFASCTDCHADAHRGTATVAGGAVDCAACHTVDRFTPSTWPRSEHARTRYPLLGAHAATACAGCHTRAAAGSAEAATLGSARVRMRPGSGTCVTCHHDPHAARFTPRVANAAAGGCTTCHSMLAFRPASYDARAHAASAYPLEGAHRAVACQACHEELRAAPAASSLPGGRHRALRFESRARACADCHQDPHGGQFKARADGGRCEACHDVAAFAPATRFVHDRDTGFRLQGVHARTPCAACHRSTTRADGTRLTIYRPTPSRCESCHTPGGGASRPGAGPGPRRAPILLHRHGEV